MAGGALSRGSAGSVAVLVLALAGCEWQGAQAGSGGDRSHDDVVAATVTSAAATVAAGFATDSAAAGSSTTPADGNAASATTLTAEAPSIAPASGSAAAAASVLPALGPAVLGAVIAAARQARAAPAVASRPRGAAPRSAAGTARSAATAAELDALAAELDVPVAGVPRSALRDSYHEARGDRVHAALDILAPRGTPVVAATDGRLLKLFDSRAGGLMVYTTDASERFILFYGHLDSYAEGLREGMELVRGQVIGYVGTTGNAPPDTPHLHFGVLRGSPRASWSSGAPVNPYTLLRTARDLR
jgi:peptidoglycan LD-endopeptidase LytH